METALFSPSALFRDQDEDGGTNPEVDENAESETLTTAQLYVERTHSFSGMELMIREFSFHHLNANLLWPGSFSFSEWLVHNQSILEGHRILELGSGTGALAIFLSRSFGVDITTSDFDDKEVEENIAYNCRINWLAVLPHIRHSWGDVFPTTEPDWDLIIASDILLYVKQYPKLIKTLCFLLNSYKPKDVKALDGSSQRNRTMTISGKQIQLQQPFFLMSWRRRIGRDDELFFSGCENAGLVAEHIGSRVYYISPKRLRGQFHLKLRYLVLEVGDGSDAAVDWVFDSCIHLKDKAAHRIGSLMKWDFLKQTAEVDEISKSFSEVITKWSNHHIKN